MLGRRSFLKGLGALLATSAMVRPAAPVFEAITNAMPSSVPPLPNGDYVCIVSPWQKRLYDEIMAYEPPAWDDFVEERPLFSGQLGEYRGVSFIEGR